MNVVAPSTELQRLTKLKKSEEEPESPPIRKRTLTETSDLIRMGWEEYTEQSVDKDDFLAKIRDNTATRNTIRKSTLNYSPRGTHKMTFTRSKSRSNKRSTLPAMSFNDFYRDYETKRKVKQELLQDWKSQEKLFLKFFSDPRRIYLKKKQHNRKE